MGVIFISKTYRKMEVMEMKKYDYTDVSIIAAPFGYGPLGKAIAIGRAFDRTGHSVKILGDKNAVRIISKAGFSANTYVYRDTLNLRQLNSRLVISCLDISTRIIKEDVPLILVDSLFWLRNRWERPLNYPADFFLAQRFFMDGDQKTIQKIKDKFSYVDAILSPSYYGILPPKERKILFYPGGLRSPYLGDEYGNAYYRWSMNLIISAMERNCIPIELLNVILPPQIATNENVKYLQNKHISFYVSVNDTADLMLSATHCFIAPGIETTLEAIASGIRPCFMPAFNGSHIPQLIAFRQAAVGKELSSIFNYGTQRFEKYTDNLSKLSLEVEKYTLEKLKDTKVFEEALESISSYLNDNQFLEERFPLGYDGANQIVDYTMGMMSK